MIGSIAMSLCHVASARFDAMISLRASRSVDAAAGQLIVREAGGTVAFPDVADGELGASLKLDMRSRVVAGPSAPCSRGSAHWRCRSPGNRRPMARLRRVDCAGPG